MRRKIRHQKASLDRRLGLQFREGRLPHIGPTGGLAIRGRRSHTQYLRAVRGEGIPTGSGGQSDRIVGADAKARGSWFRIRREGSAGAI